MLHLSFAGSMRAPQRKGEEGHGRPNRLASTVATVPAFPMVRSYAVGSHTQRSDVSPTDFNRAPRVFAEKYHSPPIVYAILPTKFPFLRRARRVTLRSRELTKEVNGMALVDLSNREQSPMPAYTCANCGRMIGAMEQPYQWGESVVCPQCCALLQTVPAGTNPIGSYQSRPRRRQKRNHGPLLAVAVLFVILLSGVVVYIESQPVAPPSSMGAKTIPQGNAPETPRSPMQSASAPRDSASNPQSQVRCGRILGAAWIKRRSGRSDIQRGLELEIFATNVRREVVIRCLGTQSDGWKASAAQLQGFAREWRAKWPDDRSHADKYDRDAADARTRAESCNEAGNRALYEMDFLDAFRMLSELSREKVPAPELFVLPIMKVHTDSDGKFQFDEVPVGAYYIHARLCLPSEVSGADVPVAEWCIPIEVLAEQSKKIDLFNDNTEYLFATGNWLQ